jgi:hypothetical protein
MRTAPKVFLNEFEYVRASFMIIPVAIEEVFKRRKRLSGFLSPIAVIPFLKTQILNHEGRAFKA